MKFLKDRLLEDKKITVLLDEVAEGELQLTALTVSSACITKNNFASMSFFSWCVCVLHYLKLFLVAFCSNSKCYWAAY